MKHCVHTFTRQIATQVKAQIAQTLPEISAKTSPPSKNSSKKGVASADVMVERVLPVNCTKRSKGSYCLKCGLVGRPSALRNQHYTDQNKKCRLTEHLGDGTILTGTTIDKVKIPEEVVNLIRKGEFDYGDHNDPKRKRISVRVQSIEELSCQASGNNLVSLVFLDEIQSMM